MMKRMPRMATWLGFPICKNGRKGVRKPDLSTVSRQMAFFLPPFQIKLSTFFWVQMAARNVPFSSSLKIRTYCLSFYLKKQIPGNTSVHACFRRMKKMKEKWIVMLNGARCQPEVK
jgi:hypothetical protein